MSALENLGCWGVGGANSLGLSVVEADVVNKLAELLVGGGEDVVYSEAMLSESPHSGRSHFVSRLTDERCEYCRCCGCCVVKLTLTASKK